jgi:flagellar motor switch protein FliG
MTEDARAAGLRKAAILVASLDDRAADAVLSQMDPAVAQRVRQSVAEMDRIDPEEQRRAIEDFRRLAPLVPRKLPPGIELDDRLARRFFPPEQAPAVEAADVEAPRLPPFRFLREAKAEKLARILAAESPQVIALVISHLPAPQAGNLLARLAPALQVEVIRRLVDLEETDPGILREVERGLETRLSEQIRMQRRRVAGVAAVAGILQSAERAVGRQILENLAAHDRALAEKLNPQRVEFDGLLQLSDAALGAVLDAVDVELVVLALVGAPAAYADRFLERFPETEARAIRYRLEHFGPIRLSDVEEARLQLADAARQLALQGQIELPQATSQSLIPNP